MDKKPSEAVAVLRWMSKVHDDILGVGLRAFQSCKNLLERKEGAKRGYVL
jgi:hypothetical protein